MSEAEDMLRAAVRVGPWPIAALKEILRGAGVTEWHLRRAASSLTAAGELTIIRAHFWASPSFRDAEWYSQPYVEGHSRAQLVARLSTHAQPSPAQSTTERLMQGEDAERLAREAFARGQA